MTLFKALLEWGSRRVKVPGGPGGIAEEAALCRVLRNVIPFAH
jgi:hypothetical protein